ncbi:hypothetical protein AZE42_05199 [Rhizopogon vesiculosus]|uniref:Heterokaryon incompatibility domain-containing protein n=1 Tax=Rhizopogon vesiculosus TaxID=180088 RepID=A0A1J8PEN2_9AGAM|nr:hypothetical protein AZE42_05199 [Rhizopogon vesiculosus]
MSLVGRDYVREHFRNSVPNDGSSYDSYDSYCASDHVKYAVLSHRWLRQGEPTYKEMEARTASGPGYEKLQKFCEKAKEYDVEFAWSDTCCIDKSSSTELDESIRSMFRWYNNSAICIIHLAQSKTIEDIMGDEWTTRGWTLQELLAPHKIKFFNEDWMPMTNEGNDKSIEMSDTMKTLERATGIDHHHLLESLPGPHLVDIRMSWAARRKTTRVEDVAYSLMGIFDVSLQIAYGEGGERAFCRLIEAIMQSGDPSVLNWAGSPSYHRTSLAIPRSPHNFVGRRAFRRLSDMQLEMTITSRGLRVPLVMFPLNCLSTRETEGGYYCIIFDCPLCPSMELVINTKSGLTQWGSNDQFALGILTYSLINDGSREAIGILPLSVGFFLSRAKYPLSPAIPSTDPNPFTSRSVGIGTGDTITPSKYAFSPWTAAKTSDVGLVELNFPNATSSSMFYMDRKYLETVYL